MADDLQIPLLRSFVAIADTGGFYRAASARGISQSTVSQHVRQLERALDMELVRKDGRRTKFTPAGERLLGEARRILAVHDDVQTRLTDIVSKPVISIGSTETAAEELLPEILASVKAAFPDRQVQFHIERSTRMSELLDRGSIDIALMLGFDGETPGAVVGRLPLKWYSSTTRAPSPSPDGHAKLRLVAYTEPCGMRQRALRALHDAGNDVEIVAESGNLEGVIAGARAGLGLAVLPSAGGAPYGLAEHSEFPHLGEIGVHLAVRRGGVEGSIVSTVLGALRRFFPSSAEIDVADVVAVAASADAAGSVASAETGGPSPSAAPSAQPDSGVTSSTQRGRRRRDEPSIRELAEQERWSVVTI